MIKKLDKNKIMYIILSLVTFLFFINRIRESSLEKGIIFSLIFVFLIIIIIGYFIMIKYFEKLKLESLFLVLSIFFGIFYIIGFPPSQLPDDSSDYFRALEVSEFHLTTPMNDKVVGREYSVNVGKVYKSSSYKDMLNNMNLKLEGEKKLYSYANKSLYSFVCYLPQAIGIGIGRIFNLPIIFQIILGKMFNFALYLLVFYLAIKYIPLKKELIAFIGLLPISMQEGSSLSADCMTIWSSIGLISFVIWTKISKTKFEKKHYISLALLLICVSMSKIVYLPLCFLILLIPKECYKNKKDKIIYSVIILFVSIILNLVWLKISSPYLDAFKYSGRSNSSEQLKYILSNPFNYIIILFNTIDNNLFLYLEQLVGHSLGSWKVTTSFIFVVISLIALFYLMIKKNSKENILNIKEKIFTWLIVIGTIGLIFTSLYMQWTALKAPIIDGVQGRYFIPLLPIITFALLTKNIKDVDDDKYLIIISLMFNIVSLLAIYKTFI